MSRQLHWRGLWQPGRLLWWQWLFFNVMSSACAWVLHTVPLVTAAQLLVAFVALLNVLFGLAAMWLLLKPPAGPAAPPPPPPPSPRP